MKKIFYLMAVTAMVIVSCQPKTETLVVDLEAEKAAINDLLNNFFAAYDASDVAGFTSFLADEALCVGSDPSEFWNKEQFTEVWKEMFPEGASLPKTQLISELEMKLAADGKSATVIHQYVMPDFIPKLISRQTYYLVKNDKWEILVLNYGFAPYNEDLPKIIAALE